jgi:hypothetical protein
MVAVDWTELNWLLFEGLIYLLYPVVYKPLCQLFRWYALLENIVRYSPFGPQAFHVRERDELGLLPPVPEFAMSAPQDIDWRTLWAVKVAELTCTRQRVRTRLL